MTAADIAGKWSVSVNADINNPIAEGLTLREAIEVCGGLEADYEPVSGIRHSIRSFRVRVTKRRHKYLDIPEHITNASRRRLANFFQHLPEID
jgi:hypothetical protein